MRCVAEFIGVLLIVVASWTGVMVGVDLLFNPAAGWFLPLDAFSSMVWGAGWMFAFTTWRLR